MRQLKVPVDCDKIMMNKNIDAADISVLNSPPPELIPYYTMNKLSRYTIKYINQVYDSQVTNHTLVWTEQQIKRQIEKVNEVRIHKRRRVGPYGDQTKHFFNSIVKHIPVKGKRVLVIGSESPWLEASALLLEASHVVTLEYGKIQSFYPNLTAMLPSEMRERYANKTLEYFDVVLSFSSLEHSGLGRYGDALNPWGDILAVARARCITKPGGYLGIAVPSGALGDHIRFNEMRSYGKYRYPLLTANWEQIDGEDHRQNIKRKRHTGFMFRRS